MLLFTTSLTFVAFARFRPIEPLFAPVMPVVSTTTNHVAVGAVPDGLTALIVGAVPPVFVLAIEKLAAATLLTGSEYVTVQLNGPEFTIALAPVTVTSFTESDALVTSGISAGDKVVTLGVQKLDAGQKVRALERR